MARTKTQRKTALTSAEIAESRAKSSLAAAERKPKPPPPGLKAAGKESWRATQLLPWIGPEHEAVALRLAELNDDRAELRAEIKKSGWLGTGSTGQPVVSPLVDALRSCEVAISRLERQLGVSVTAHRAAVVADDIAAGRRVLLPNVVRTLQGLENEHE